MEGFPFIVRALISKWLVNGGSYDHCTSQNAIVSGCRPWIWFAIDDILLTLLPLHNHHDLIDDWSMELCRFLEVLDSFYSRSLNASEFLDILIDSIASSFIGNIINDLDGLNGSGYPDPLDWYDEDFPCRVEFNFHWHYASVA